MSYARATPCLNGGARRSACILWLAALLTSLAPSSASGEEVVVPVALQAELVAKVAAYDRNFAARAGDQARILILVKAGDSQSARTANQLQRALAGLGDIAGLSHIETLGSFTSAAEIASSCGANKFAVVYLTPGFENEVSDIARALAGVSVLTVSAIPGYVPKGVVLGFDSESGKSKLLVNLTQARLQQVAFKSEILKLMKVFE
jgi:hypothetical protein